MCGRLSAPERRCAPFRARRLPLRCAPAPDAQTRSGNKKKTDLGIARTESNGLFLSRDQLLHRPGHELAPSEMRVCVGPVAVERDHCLVFGNGLVASVLRAQHLGFGEMCERAAGRCGQGSLGQAFGAHDVGRGRAGHKIKDAGGELDSQPALRRDGFLIERQRPLEQRNRLRTALTRWRLQPRSAPPQKAIPRIPMLGRSVGRLRRPPARC